MLKLAALGCSLCLAACLQESDRDRSADAPRRHLVLAPDSVSVTLADNGPNPGHTEFQACLKNRGTVVEAWEIATGIPHAQPSFAYGYLAPRDSVYLRFSVENAKYPAGTFPHRVTVRYADGDSLAAFQATIVSPEQRRLVVHPPGAVTFTFRAQDTTLRLANHGNSPLQWRADFDSALLAFTPSNGRLDIGDSLRIDVAVRRPAGIADSVRTPVSIVANDFREYSTHYVIHTYPEKKQLLGYPLADAEYHRGLDRLLTVDSAAPSRLRIHTLPGGPVREIPLPMQAYCVGANAAGTRAVIGHDKAFTLVNLETSVVEKTYPVSLDVGDILLTAKGWVYLVPRNGQHPPVTGFDLASATEVLSVGTTSPKATLRLHPSETHLYSSDAIASPQDIRKFDISGGRPVFLHDSQYHGRYITGGLFWLSEDGAHLYSSSGSWFQLSDNRADDLVYRGDFGRRPYWVEHSLAADRLFLVGPQSPKLHLYAARTYAPLDSVPLADFLEDEGAGPSRRVPSDPRMVFASADGKRVHVLMQANSPMNPAFGPWAIQTLETEKLP